MVSGMMPMESASYMGLTSLRLIFIKVLEDYLKFQLFQIDSLAENFCLLEYAHIEVKKTNILQRKKLHRYDQIAGASYWLVLARR